MSFREALSLVNIGKDVAAYPDGKLSLVPVGLHYELRWVRSFCRTTMHIDARALVADAQGTLRLSLLSQLLAEWRFVVQYNPTAAEWAAFVQHVFGLYPKKSKDLTLSETVFRTYSTYSPNIPNLSAGYERLLRYMNTCNLIREAKGA